jgi:hypothetical protein
MANIAAIDYDPGASEVNQLNRIKLMLATADKNAARKGKGQTNGAGEQSRGNGKGKRFSFKKKAGRSKGLALFK